MKKIFVLLFFLINFFIFPINTASAFIGSGENIPVSDNGDWKGKDVEVNLFLGDLNYTVPIQSPPPRKKLQSNFNVAGTLKFTK